MTRSRGPDGTVSLELHAGVEQELEGAVQWVAEQVFVHRLPLQEIAVLVPTPDPLGQMVADRIRAMPWPDDIEPVYLACGAPAVATASGARLLALVGTLEAFLSAPAVIELLPRLRLAERDGHVTPGRARAIASMLGTLGGSTLRPMDALRWRDRLRRVDVDEHTRLLTPALEALVALAEQIIRGESLGKLWEAIREFAERHVIGGKEMRDLLCGLGEEVVELASDPVAHDIAGADAVRVIATLLASLRQCEGRYGMPSIFVGTITGAAGLSFSAVRVLGLAEGLFPGTLREDSILPAELRQRLPEAAMATNDDYATGRLHAFDRIVRGTRARLALSTSRVDLDGSEREPASLFIEAAAALARPNARTGAPARVIPTIADIDRDWFQNSREVSARRCSSMPLTAAMWLNHVAAARDRLPSAWATQPVLHPLEVLRCSDRMDGVLGTEPLTLETFGLSAESPVSASELRMLLTCPQRFLLERLLRLRPRPAPIDPYRIDAATYGKLVHKVAEEFARAHGIEFGARRDGLSRWLEVADELCRAIFESFVDGYPLIGTSVIEAERTRLRHDVRTLIEHDWNGGQPREFVMAEVAFGDDHPVLVATSAGPLFLDGRIDRVDIEGGVTLVRDLKTGRARARDGDQADPQVELDLQLAVYVAAAHSMSAHARWSIPEEVAAAYVYLDPVAVDRERAFREDVGALREAGQQWFEIAASLLRERMYVKTPKAKDCEHCPFGMVCGSDNAASVRRLEGATGTLAAFRDLKA